MKLIFVNGIHSHYLVFVLIGGTQMCYRDLYSISNFSLLMYFLSFSTSFRIRFTSVFPLLYLLFPLINLICCPVIHCIQFLFGGVFVYFFSYSVYFFKRLTLFTFAYPTFNLSQASLCKLSIS